MNTTSINRFKENLKNYIEEVISTHTPPKVTQRSSGDDFVVMSAKDWEREQETLYVLQNSNLMQQLAESVATHAQGKGYCPSEDQLNDLI
jgi:antitoxin YefM